MPKRGHDSDSSEDTYGGKLSKISEEAEEDDGSDWSTISDQKTLPTERTEHIDGSDWSTISEQTTPSCTPCEFEGMALPTERTEHNSDEEGSESKLRVERKTTPGPSRTPDPEATTDKKDEETKTKRPSASQLKIHPKDYVPPKREEKTQPSAFYDNSDEDSDNENRPKKEFSDEQLRNTKVYYPLKRPPKKYQ